MFKLGYLTVLKNMTATCLKIVGTKDWKNKCY